MRECGIIKKKKKKNCFLDRNNTARESRNSSMRAIFARTFFVRKYFLEPESRDPYVRVLP